VADPPSAVEALANNASYPDRLSLSPSEAFKQDVLLERANSRPPVTSYGANFGAQNRRPMISSEEILSPEWRGNPILTNISDTISKVSLVIAADGETEQANDTSILHTGGGSILVREETHRTDEAASYRTTEVYKSSTEATVLKSTEATVLKSTEAAVTAPSDTGRNSNLRMPLFSFADLPLLKQFPDVNLQTTKAPTTTTTPAPEVHPVLTTARTVTAAPEEAVTIVTLLPVRSNSGLRRPLRKKPQVQEIAATKSTPKSTTETTTEVVNATSEEVSTTATMRKNLENSIKILSGLKLVLESRQSHYTTSAPNTTNTTDTKLTHFVITTPQPLNTTTSTTEAVLSTPVANTTEKKNIARIERVTTESPIIKPRLNGTLATQEASTTRRPALRTTTARASISPVTRPANRNRKPVTAQRPPSRVQNRNATRPVQKPKPIRGTIEPVKLDGEGFSVRINPAPSEPVPMNRTANATVVKTTKPPRPSAPLRTGSLPGQVEKVTLKKEPFRPVAPAEPSVEEVEPEIARQAKMDVRFHRKMNFATTDIANHFENTDKAGDKIKSDGALEDLALGGRPENSTLKHKKSSTSVTLKPTHVTTQPLHFSTMTKTTKAPTTAKTTRPSTTVKTTTKNPTTTKNASTTKAQTTKSTSTTKAQTPKSTTTTKSPTTAKTTVRTTATTPVTTSKTTTSLPPVLSSMVSTAEVTTAKMESGPAVSETEEQRNRTAELVAAIRAAVGLPAKSVSAASSNPSLNQPGMSLLHKVYNKIPSTTASLTIDKAETANKTEKVELPVVAALSPNPSTKLNSSKYVNLLK